MNQNRNDDRKNIIWLVRKRYIILSTVTLILAIFYIAYSDHLPPRTPIKIARIVSGLNISSDIEFELLEDRWMLNGDGHALVKGKLTDEQLSEIIKQAKQLNYKQLPTTEMYIPAIGTRDNGFYMLKEIAEDPRNFKITVIDLNRREIVAFVSVS